MEFEIKKSQSGNYVIVKFFANLTRELGRQILPKVEAFGLEHNISSLLFDLRESRNNDSVNAKVLFSIKDMPDPKNRIFEKSAMLVNPKDPSHSLVIVGLANAGYNIRMFTSESEAIEWLEEKI